MSLDKYRSNPNAVREAAAGVNERDGHHVVRLNKIDGPLKFRVLPAASTWPTEVPGYPKIHRTQGTPFTYAWKHVFRDPRDPEKWVAFACPERNGGGEKCAVCAEGWKRHRLDKEDKALLPNRETYFNALVLVGPDELLGKVVTFGLTAPVGKPSGKTQIEKLLAAAQHPDTGGDILDPLDGYVISSGKSGSGRDTNYTFALDIRRGATPLADSEDAIIDMIETQPDIFAALTADVQGGQAKIRELSGGAQPRGALPPKGPQRAEDDLYGDDLSETDDVDY